MTEQINQDRFKRWIEVSGDEATGFVGFVDGDDVETGKNFEVVATNTASIATQRGMPGQYDIFSAEDKKSIPH